MRQSYQNLYHEFERVLLKMDFTAEKAKACATLFTDNSLDGVYSHGLNRFPVFIDYVNKGYVNKDAEPTLTNSFGSLEQWDGNLGPGMLNAQFCMDRAITLAKEKGMACIALKNTNHWMRAGAYGWRAANAGCISINFTNTIGIMPPWGGKEPTLGNNPLVIAIPHPNGAIVLDMAMSQYSYGKLEEYELMNKELPYFAGFDADGELTKNAKTIRELKSTLPIGMWKGSGLAMMLDLLASILSDGKSTAAITKTGEEKSVSQVFICFDEKLFANSKTIIDEVIAYTKGETQDNTRYPGENTLKTREENFKFGIPVDEKMWERLLSL